MNKTKSAFVVSQGNSFRVRHTGGLPGRPLFFLLFPSPGSSSSLILILRLTVSWPDSPESLWGKHHELLMNSATGKNIWVIQWKCVHMYIYIHAFSRRFYPKQLYTSFLEQCSTTEPQEHLVKHTKYCYLVFCKLISNH